MHASPVVSIKQDELCRGRPITVVERYIHNERKRQSVCKRNSLLWSFLWIGGALWWNRPTEQSRMSFPPLTSNTIYLYATAFIIKLAVQVWFPVGSESKFKVRAFTENKQKVRWRDRAETTQLTEVLPVRKMNRILQKHEYKKGKKKWVCEIAAPVGRWATHSFRCFLPLRLLPI